MKSIKNSLEGILGEERFKKIKDSKAYNWVVEALALNTYSYVIAAPLALGLAGMDFSAHIN